MPRGSVPSRYETILKLASGGMATVWVGTVRGALGFRQLVAIKKPHPHLLDDPAFRAELIAEARLASMIRHVNVVDVRDVEVDGDAISLVMDYIEGASLGDLLVAASRRGERLPPRVCVRVALDALAGLQAAHELVDEKDRPVGLVHRDVSPQNILVGTDGTSRVADFGVAKFSRKNMQSTSEGSLKGKLAYMPPEYLRGEAIDRRFDVFGLGVVLWEALTGRRLFRGENEADTLHRVLLVDAEAVSRTVPQAAPLDAVVSHALAKERAERFQNAAAMAAALESSASSAGLLGSHREVAEALKGLVGDRIEERRALVRSKLAHEPSVASLVFVPPIVEAAPSTLPDVGPPRADTPKMGGGAAPPAQQVATVIEAPATTMGVPTTLPMTPKMGGAGATLAAGAGGLAPAEHGAAPIPPRTLASASPIPMGASSTLRSDAPPRDVAELAFHEASGRSFTGEVAPDGVPKRTSRWLVPAIAIALATAIASAVVVVVAVRTTSEAKPVPTTPAPRDPPPSPSASSTPMPVPSPAAVPTASATPSASASQAAASATPPPRVQPGRAQVPASPRKPPPNPYVDP